MAGSPLAQESVAVAVLEGLLGELRIPLPPAQRRHPPGSRPCAAAASPVAMPAGQALAPLSVTCRGRRTCDGRPPLMVAGRRISAVGDCGELMLEWLNIAAG